MMLTPRFFNAVTLRCERPQVASLEGWRRHPSRLGGFAASHLRMTIESGVRM
jgi:hypothetical protein